MASAFVVALLLSTALAGCGGAAGEEAGPLVPVRLDLVAGHHARELGREVVIEEGDVLGAIARRELGSAQRHPEIVAWNPGVRPKRLIPGDRLLLPPREPRDPAAIGAQLYWQGLDERHIARWDPEAPLPALVREDAGGVRLLCVPVERMGVWTSWLEQHRKALQRGQAPAEDFPEGVFASEGFGGTDHLPAEAPEGAQLRHEVTLKGVDEGSRSVDAEVRVLVLGADGSHLYGELDFQEESAFLSLPLALFALAFALSALLIWRSRAHRTPRG